MSSNKKNIIIHDNFEIYGGAEQLLFQFSKALKIKIFSFYVNKKINNSYFSKFFFSNKSNFDPRIRFLLNFIFYFFFPFNFKKYNNILLSGHFSLMLLKKGLNNKIIYFCHSPPRFIFDNYKLYKKKYKFVYSFILTKKLISIYRNIYIKKLKLCNIIICNSNTSKKRISKYISQKNIHVIYPGIDFKKYYTKKNENFYLSLSRLHWSKRIIEKIITFSNHKLKNTKLIICSHGPLEKKIKKIIKNLEVKNIEFLGKVTDKKKISLLSTCKGLIHIPIREEFGIINLEAIASKKILITTDGGDFEKIFFKNKNVKIIKNYSNSKLLNIIHKIEKNKFKFKPYNSKKFKKKFSINNSINQINKFFKSN